MRSGRGAQVRRRSPRRSISPVWSRAARTGAGETIRVNAALVAARSGRQLAATRFDRPMSDFFSLLDEAGLALTHV